MNKNVLLISDLSTMEHICPKCVNHGSVHCPNRSQVGDEKLEDFPQIIKGEVTPTKILVYACSEYIKRAQMLERATENGKPIRAKSVFVWNMKTRSFVKRMKK